MNESHNWPAPDPIQAGSTQKNLQPSSPGDFQLADFGQRIFAFFLDLLMTFSVIIIGSIGLGVVVFALRVDTNQDVIDGFSGLLFIAIVILRIYWITQGGSPLRRRYGVLIVDENTFSSIGFGRATLRLFVAVVGLPLLVGYLGFLWPLWDPKKQTWHDKAARTLVVKR